MSDSIERSEFEGQVAIVTGGGRGLGRAYCLDLAARGAAVVVNDVGVDRDTDVALADQVVAEIHHRGGRAVAARESVTTAEGAQAIVDAALATFGSLEIVVNNAGFLRNNYFAELSDTQINEVLDVHLRAAFRVTQPAWRYMRERGYGRILLTSSAAGMLGLQGQANYASAKAGLFGLCKSLAIEGAPFGIRTNVLLPMALGATAIAQQDPVPGWRENYDWDARRKLDGREGVDSVTPLVAYLVSRRCQVSGEAFSAVAGRYARVFVGVTRGWFAPDAHRVTMEDIEQHLDVIRDREDFTVPGTLIDEVRAVAVEASRA